MRAITRKTLEFCVSIFSLILVIGCSDYVVKNPFRHFNLEDLFEKSVLDRGTSLSKGMTQYALLKKWGCPDDRKIVGETKFGAPIEEWTYYAWIPGFPVNYRYIAKEYRLTFHGDILMSYEDTDIIKPKSKDIELKEIENKADGQSIEEKKVSHE